MRIHLACFEDGITATGFRKLAGFVERLNAETCVSYVSTKCYRTFRKSLTRTFGEAPGFAPEHVEEIARGLAGAEVIGLSSMTGYADLTKTVIARLRAISPSSFIVWGGIHPIIYPEDAVQCEADAICTGEGELAFEELLHHLQAGTDFTAVRNFWFRRDSAVVRNPFRPLMTAAELEDLPYPKYGGSELIYQPGEGFLQVSRQDYLNNNGLGYPAIWSIGCPLHCTFCGNTVFIANDKNYKRIRHTSPAYIVGEVRRAREVHPHLTTVLFFDDSFMAIPLRELEEFATLWHRELALPFAVYGVIPTYVQRQKLEVLTWAGMNRVRMGIQSGSERLLRFYRRPTPVAKIEQAAVELARFSRHHINPSYDLIVDNPAETRQDVVDTLELAYRLARPFTFNIFSLRVIPNTTLERQMRDEGLDVERINENYHRLRPTLANVLLYLLTMVRPPRLLFDRLLRRVRGYGEAQRYHPVLLQLVRLPWLLTQAWRHLRVGDFSLITGRTGYLLWRIGLLRPRRPAFEPPGEPPAAGLLATQPESAS